MLQDSTHGPKWNGNPKKYIDGKIKILTNQFFIRPTQTEIAHLETLKTQTEIDNGIIQVINNHWK